MSSVYEIPREGGDAGSVTMGSQVNAAFRLMDQIPFGVRQDMAKLIYLYMHDPVGYDEKKREIFAKKEPPAETPKP